MKARPILMSAPMVRALLDGRKQQTRRVLRKQPYISFLNPPRFTDVAVGDLFVCPDLLPTSSDRGNVIVEVTGQWTYHCMGQKAFAEKHCPYGRPGDLLWVRESFRFNEGGAIRDAAGGFEDYVEPHFTYMADNGGDALGSGWKPSIHMPRWASRLTLELTEVRIERLQSISEANAKAEGVFPLAGKDGRWGNGKVKFDYSNPLSAFIGLWCAINGQLAWKENPYVWALTFRVHQQNVDTLLAERGQP